MVRRFLLSLVVVCSFPLFAQTFVFHLSGDQEVPPVPSTHSGGCMATLDQPAAQLSITCVHDVTEATVMHIHRNSGAIAFDLGNPTSPVNKTWTGMTPQDIADLLAGEMYINVHTAGRPAGEIRGQILQRTVDVVEFTAEGSQVVPPNGTASTASCIADLDANATSLAIQCTHNVAAAESAHVHRAPFGQIGPAIYTFPSAASPLSGNVPLTAEQVAAFAATFLYLDIHAPGSEEDPGDEIRGQIGIPPQAATTGTVIIRKATYPSGGEGVFDFTETITSGGFQLADGGARTFLGVSPGTYSVTESAMPAGYSLADIACDDLDSTGNSATRAATIRVDAGETITCTFRNVFASPADSIFVFHLSGDQEVPPVTTTDRGGCMGRFDAGENALTLVCTHDVDLPTVMHIHRGAAGENGPIAFDMGEPTSPVIATWANMTPADVADLFAGKLYLNIHTAGRPAGVVRGQIVERSVDTIAFPMDATQVVPPGTSNATGNCTADLSNDATSLAIQCTHNLPSPQSAHVHDAPRGENGPIVATFSSPASPISETIPLTPRLVADYAAYFLYVDVHGAEGEEDAAGDSIRGQIGVAPSVVTTGTIRIVKSTSPAGGTGFNFTHNVGAPGAFTLADAQVHTFSNVAAGTYTITEALPAGWSLTGVSCDDTNSTGNPYARAATINLQGNETVTCTFRNLQNVAATQLFVFDLSGDQEVPPTNVTATGGCFGQLNQPAATFSIVCSHNVVGPEHMHIHRGANGENGPIVFDLGDPLSPVEATWTNMTPANIADLLAGNLYVNIHASGRPAGAIRGQILPRTVDSFSFLANAAQEVPPTDSPAAGDCFADLADDASSLFVRCSHTVAAPTSIHLHAAPTGTDGPAVFDYPLTNPFSGNTPMTPRLIADFAAGFLYVNIHSANYPEGEIRGQLIGAPAAPAAASIPTLSEWALLLLAATLALLAIRR
jgi:hypothetical protein